MITAELKNRNLLFKEEEYEHDYPFCWRCSSPLIYYAKQGWFVDMQKLKKDLIKNNQQINWIPAHLKKGRFGEWLKEIKDWNFSRERYWATPLPVWQCKNCQNQEVIGSKEDFKKQKFSLTIISFKTWRFFKEQRRRERYSFLLAGEVSLSFD